MNLRESAASPLQFLLTGRCWSLWLCPLEVVLCWFCSLLESFSTTNGGKANVSVPALFLNVSITGNWFHFKAHLYKNRDIFHSMVTGFSCYCFRAELQRWNEVRASQPLMVKRLWSDGSFGSRKVRTQSHISSTTSPENRRGRDNPSFQVHTGQMERNHTFLFHSTE